MYHHLAAYGASLAAGPNLDTAAAADGILGIRNNHLILTEPFNLIWSEQIGALMTRARFGNAALSQKGIQHLWPIQVSATQPSLPQINDLRDEPLILPMNEEITIESSNSAAGPTITSILLGLAKPEWSRNFPSYEDRLSVRATVVAPAGTTTTWNVPATIVMERDLLSGVYAVVGCYVVAAGALAFRMVFPDQPPVGNKQLRPGAPVQNTTATQPNPDFKDGLGEWGRFHTFTLPQIQVFGDAAGGTYEVRLDLLYLGHDEDLLYAKR